MKKKLVWMLTLLLILLPNFQVFAEDKIETTPDEYCELAISARNPDVHGKYVCFEGYLENIAGTGWCIFQNERDYLYDRKENAVWVEGSILDVLKRSDWDTDDELDLCSRLRQGDYMYELLIGYVNLNDRGPGGKYAATIQADPVTEPYRGEIPRREITGGETEEEPIEVSVIRLFGDIWRYQDRWVKVLGEWDVSHTRFSFRPIDPEVWFGPKFVMQKEDARRELLENELEPLFGEELYEEMDREDIFVRVAGKVMEVQDYLYTETHYSNGEIERTREEQWYRSMGFSEMVDFRLHPLCRKELEEKYLGGTK